MIDNAATGCYNIGRLGGAGPFAPEGTRCLPSRPLFAACHAPSKPKNLVQALGTPPLRSASGQVECPPWPPVGLQERRRVVAAPVGSSAPRCRSSGRRKWTTTAARSVAAFTRSTGRVSGDARNHSCRYEYVQAAGQQALTTYERRIWARLAHIRGLGSVPGLADSACSPPFVAQGCRPNAAARRRTRSPSPRRPESRPAAASRQRARSEFTGQDRRR